MKASGRDPFKKPAAPRKRKDPAEKRKVTSFEGTEKVSSLAKMCIEVCDSFFLSSSNSPDCFRCQLLEIGALDLHNWGTLLGNHQVH